MTRKLLIVASDHVSAWTDKGEVIDRYYNPGNLFDEIHLLLINNDRPDKEKIQRMSGTAKAFIHNYPEPARFFTKTLGWQLPFITSWAKGCVPLIKKIGPDVIRCHGAHLNSYIASLAKSELKIPYVVSLHINPDENFRKAAKNFKDRIIFNCLKKIEKIGLRKSDLVLPVYSPIVPYLKALGISHYKVCYNVLNDEHLLRKTNYNTTDKFKVVSIGRQFEQKDPSHLISALKNFPNIEITFIGGGEYHERLKKHASQEKVDHQVKFIKAVSNDELCESLHTYDFLAIHTEHFEISKVVLECFLVGLPVLLNYRVGDQVPELTDEICLRVENSVQGFKEGLERMISSEEFRQKLGKKAYETAQEKWAPKKCEGAYVDVYKRFLK